MINYNIKAKNNTSNETSKHEKHNIRNEKVLINGTLDTTEKIIRNLNILIQNVAKGKKMTD